LKSRVRIKKNIPIVPISTTDDHEADEVEHDAVPDHRGDRDVP
jgi:hypothetical protein